MSQYVACPSCGVKQLTGVEPDSQGECKSCGQAFVVPSARIAKERRDLKGHNRRRSNFVPILTGLGIAIVICGGTLMPSVSQPGRTSDRSQSANKIRQIALACLGYFEANQCLPPVNIENNEGTAAASWRVLILRELDEHETFYAYDVSKPWDDPKNATVSQTPVELYHNPSSNEPQVNTNYVMVKPDPGSQSETAARANRGVHLAEIVDGSANTILIVEVEGLNIPWAKPQDITVSELLDLVRSGKAETHEGGFHIARVDGSVEFVSKDTLAKNLELMCYINDGEPKYSQ